MNPAAVWKAADGLSKQKTVRLIWPELADALEGVTRRPLDVVGRPGEPDPTQAPEPEQQPVCGNCRVNWARGELENGAQLCVECYGRANARRLATGQGSLRARLRTDWPKIGPVKPPEQGW